MRIIKEGKLPESEVVQGTCYNCKAVVEFRLDEGEVTHDQREGTFSQIKCPTEGCPRKITGYPHKEMKAKDYYNK